MSQFKREAAREVLRQPIIIIIVRMMTTSMTMVSVNPRPPHHANGHTLKLHQTCRSFIGQKNNLQPLLFQIERNIIHEAIHALHCQAMPGNGCMSEWRLKAISRNLHVYHILL